MSKRKLSGAAEGGQHKRSGSGADRMAKKAKQGETAQEDAVEPSRPSDDEDEDEDTSGGEDESNASQPGSLAALAPGPHTFFSWVEALDVLLGDGEDDNPFMYLKSMAMEAYSHVAHIEDEQARQDAIGEYLEDMDYWECYPGEDDAGESSIADPLRKKWDEKESAQSGAWWWWLTDFRPADEDGDRAMTCVSVYNNTT